MKNFSAVFLTFLLISLTIALVASNFTSSEAMTPNQATAGILIQQLTPLAQPETETSLTNGILIMGVVIVLIITLPLLFRKK